MKSECVFCQYVEASDTLSGFVGIGGGQLLRKLGHIMIISPPEPVTEGHLLFVPEDHTPKPHANPIMAAHVFAMATEWVHKYGHDSYNLIMSAGAEATQTVPHMHLHYVPRREGDGLRLPWGPH